MVGVGALAAEQLIAGWTVELVDNHLLFHFLRTPCLLRLLCPGRYLEISSSLCPLCGFLLPPATQKAKSTHTSHPCSLGHPSAECRCSFHLILQGRDGAKRGKVNTKRSPSNGRTSGLCFAEPRTRQANQCCSRGFHCASCSLSWQLVRGIPSRADLTSLHEPCKLQRVA